MKKITEKEAMNLLKKGQTVTCQYSSKGIKIVKDIPELLRRTKRKLKFSLCSLRTPNKV